MRDYLTENYVNQDRERFFKMLSEDAAWLAKQNNTLFKHKNYDLELNADWTAQLVEKDGKENNKVLVDVWTLLFVLKYDGDIETVIKGGRVVPYLFFAKKYGQSFFPGSLYQDLADVDAVLEEYPWASADIYPQMYAKTLVEYIENRGAKAINWNWLKLKYEMTENEND
jgi:hypothetical protein